MITLRHALRVCLFAVSTLLAQAKVIYVNGNLNTDPPPNGLSWATAFTTVQEGINVATEGDEVWVASATYFENIY